MNRVKICAVITDRDVRSIKRAAELADLFEVRIDMIGAGWQEIVPALHKPWIAANRSIKEGGKWRRGEKSRIKELLSAIDLGAGIIDIELNDEELKDVVPQIRRKAECLISYHDWEGTPSAARLAAVVRRQLTAGADICKVVTTARMIEDNITVLKVVGMFPRSRVVAFAMGSEGMLSRVLAPLAGSYFTYASIGQGRESAPGQVPAETMRKLFGTIRWIRP
jgi:3-dehydroquinate dehydratase type I